MSLREQIRKSIEVNAKSIYDENIIADKALTIFKKFIKDLEQEDIISEDNNPDWKSGFDAALGYVKEMLE